MSRRARFNGDELGDKVGCKSWRILNRHAEEPGFCSEGDGDSVIESGYIGESCDIAFGTRRCTF